MKQQHNISWEQKQRMLDEESRAIVKEQERLLLQDRLSRLTPGRRQLHDLLNHNPNRCRCFEIEGIK